MNILQAIFRISILPWTRGHAWWSNRRDPDRKLVIHNDQMSGVMAIIR